MEPALFQSLPPISNLAATAVLLQIGILLFLKGKRYLRPASIAVVALVGAIAGGSAATAVFPEATWELPVMGLVGGALLGYFLRPVGVGFVLAYLGNMIVTSLVSIPLLQYIMAVDLFAYGIFLTDLAPTFVSSMLASLILLLSILWAGASAPAAVILASAIGASRIMASVIPSKLALREHQSVAAPV